MHLLELVGGRALRHCGSRHHTTLPNMSAAITNMLFSLGAMQVSTACTRCRAREKGARPHTSPLARPSFAGQRGASIHDCTKADVQLILHRSLARLTLRRRTTCFTFEWPTLARSCCASPCTTLCRCRSVTGRIDSSEQPYRLEAGGLWRGCATAIKPGRRIVDQAPALPRPWYSAATRLNELDDAEWPT